MQGDLYQDVSVSCLIKYFPMKNQKPLLRGFFIEVFQEAHLTTESVPGEFFSLLLLSGTILPCPLLEILAAFRILEAIPSRINYFLFYSHQHCPQPPRHK